MNTYTILIGLQSFITNKRTLLFHGTREVLRRCFVALQETEMAQDRFDAAAESDILIELIEQYSLNTLAENETLDKLANHLSKACKEMRRSLLGLNTVRVTGKIENARLVGETSSLNEIIAHLGKSQERVERHLEATKEIVDNIYRGVRNASALERRGDTPGVTFIPERRMAKTG